MLPHSTPNRFFDDVNKPCDGRNRRDFLRVIGLGAAATLSPAFSMAADSTGAVAPSDPKFSPTWGDSLLSRGEPTVYRGNDLATIGMPVGGICAGQLYLGGDGKLWHWDIFNHYSDSGCGGPHYAQPMKPTSPLEQGFGIRVIVDGKAEFRALDRSGFSAISFRGEYPIGHVEYGDPAVPLAVTLDAFSPFIPLNAQDSSIPATVMQFTVKNTGSKPVEAELIGWLENVIGLYQPADVRIDRRNHIVREPKAVVLTCEAAPAQGAQLKDTSDMGTMSLALSNPQATDAGAASMSLPAMRKDGVAGAPDAAVPKGQSLVGALARKLTLAPGQSATVSFVVAWHFPNLPLKDGGRFYATRFASAAKVAQYVAENLEELSRQTHLWRDTWYDSTLPYWFLDRTFANTSILATTTSHRFANGRFYGWEGVGCCEGTCTHVWQYAQAVARLFPELERDLRQRTDFGTAIDPQSGVIHHRGESAGLAVDGQAGCILRVYREHQMSTDSRFLQAIWPKVKLAMQCLVRMDRGEGLLEGGQHNTLDCPWFGKIAWLSSLYVAAAKACAEMAAELGDEPFAKSMQGIVERGSRNIDRQLFDGEYYIQLGDKQHAGSVGSYDGCEIDQVFGQSWAYQVGLGRILDEQNVKKALASLWKYNFMLNVGPFRKTHQPGRWYAMPGEGGLLMCAWPHGESKRGKGDYDPYFNECMTGFEYQVAGHMIWEGMVREGMAVVRAIHDRYHASRRNPWNEIECGDHYARAMASYGVYLAACGYEYHGPKKRLAFAPRLRPEDFACAFTTAEGWGTFRQKDDGKVRTASIELKWGHLTLRTLVLGLPDRATPTKVNLTVDGAESKVDWNVKDGRLTLTLPADVKLLPNQKLVVSVAC
jgi:uncharacterized protein (DUF608 family)